MNPSPPENACIWCLRVSPECADVEHIIPEALGCPPGFTLPSSVVCKECNNGLAHLDRAVIDDFDFLLFSSGVQRKKGKAPVIRSRGNVIGTVEHGKATMTFNMERTPRKAHNGETLSGYRGRQRDVKAVLSKQYSGKMRLSFDIHFGGNPKFARGLVKVAFSSLAYFCGAGIARSPDFDAIREFVRFGRGRRRAFAMNADAQPYSNRVWAPYRSSESEYAVTFRLGILEFLVDLSPDESQFERFYADAKLRFADGSWCVLPVVESA